MVGDRSLLVLLKVSVSHAGFTLCSCVEFTRRPNRRLAAENDTAILLLPLPAGLVLLPKPWVSGLGVDRFERLKR